MPEERDDLRASMRELARQAGQTTAPGLADVRHRRSRRQRNLVLASGLAVVAILGSTTLWLNPFGDSPSIQPIGPGPTAVISPGPSAGPSTGRPAPSSDRPSTGPTTPAAPTTGPAGTEPAADPVIALDLGSLVTAGELDSAGVRTQATDIGDADGQPTLPPMCGAGSWQEEHSNPVDRVSGGYPIDGGQLVLDLLGYPDAVAANAALVQLKEDARACPTVNEFLTVTVTAVGSAIGDEFVVFALDSESGQDGSIERIWVTIARVDNVLVSATIDRDPGFAGDVGGDEQLSRSAAQANVDHLLAG